MSRRISRAGEEISLVATVASVFEIAQRFGWRRPQPQA